MRGRRTTAQQKLTAAMVHLEKVIAEDDGRVPTEQALARQQTGLTNAWETYEDAHTLYVDLLEEDAAEEELEGYQAMYDGMRHCLKGLRS